MELQPAPAWGAILALVIVSVLCILAGAGSILRLAFPVGSLAVGLLLYRKYPILYIGFTWWLWFLTPLVSRLADYRNGWFDEQRLVLVSPYLVTLITIATFLRCLPKAYRQGGLPFILAFIGVFYGFLIGLIQNPLIGVSRSLLDWLTPVLFGFHLFVNWREYPSYRQNIQRTFLWGVLIMGVYGVLQYLVAPEWDRFWLVESGMTSSAGEPIPFGIRVWSTVHSPGPFSIVVMAGLLLLFSSQGTLRFPAAGAGYLAFLLSLVRSSWGAWLVGLLTFASSLNTRLQVRLITTILIITTCALPLTTNEPFSRTINSRFQSFSNLEEDTSFKDRSSIYEGNLSLALSEGLGKGLGNTWAVKDNALQVTVVDSGVIDTFFTLGWLGAIPYLGGILLPLFNLFQHSKDRFIDPFIAATRAISLSVFLTLLAGSGMLGLSGMILWGFLGIGMAARKYYQHQHTWQT